MNRISVFDSMKGLAILGVIMIHSGCNDMPGILGKIGGEGGSGVQIFFIISAFLMFSSLSKIELNGKNIRRWLTKKLLTLLPLYYLAILMSLAVNGFRGGGIGWGAIVKYPGVICCFMLCFYMVFSHIMLTV